MKKQAFSSEKYLNLQRDHIIERINQFDGKLYLEFGGKMLEDFHAARVLPWIRNQTIRSSYSKNCATRWKLSLPSTPTTLSTQKPVGI